MKKIYIALLLLAPFISKGQTITQADLPIAGTTFIMATDTTYHGSCGNQGQGQTWDFSMLINAYQDTQSFVNALGTPYESSFPASNTASYSVFNDTYAYFTNDITGFYFDGSIGLGGLIQVIPPQLFAPTPFSYGDQRGHVSRLQFDTIVVDSAGNPMNIRLVSYSDGFFKSDATGTLTTPAGTFNNVLRIKQTETLYDTVYYDMGGGMWMPLSNSTSYNTVFRYFTSGSLTNSNYILGITGDSLGTTASESEFLWDPSASVPVVKAENKLIAYPNPAFDVVNFKNILSNSAIRIYDSFGKLIMKSSGDIRSVNVATLSNGIYYYELETSGKVDKGNFVIQK